MSELAEMLDFPFPLDDGRIVHLWLPKDGLTVNEVERLRNYLESLITEKT